MGKGKEYQFLVSFAGKVNSSLNSSVGKVGAQFNNMQSLAKKAAAGIGAAFAAVKIKDFVKESVNTYKTYEQSMAQTAATATIQKGTKEYEQLDKAARAAGRATSKTAAEAADALGYMALAGWNVNQSTTALMPVLRLSEGLQSDLAVTSDLVTDSMSALGISMDNEGRNLTRYLDVITAANNKSNQTALQAMEAYIGVGGSLKRLGTPLEESGALLGVLANRGIKGSEAGNSLSSILINLTKKSGESAEAMKALGLNAYDSQGRFKGVTNVLKELNDKTKNLTPELRDTYLTMIGGKTQITTLNNLMSGLNTITADGTSELEALQKQLKNSDGALNAMADTVSNTMSFAFARLSSATDDFKIEFVSHFQDIMTPAIDSIANKIIAITPKMAKVADSIRGKFLNIKNTANEVKTAFMTLTGKDTTAMGIQFNEAGAKNTISRVMGISNERIESIVESYQKAKEGIAAIMTLAGKDTAAMGIQFNEAGAKNAISRITGMTTSQLDSLAETFQKTKQDFLTVVDTIKTAVGGIVDTVSRVVGFVASHLDTITPIVMGIAKAFIELKVISKVSSVVMQVGGAISKVVNIVTKVIPVIKTVVAVLSGPVGIAVAGITALVTVGVMLYKNWDTIKQKASEIWTNVKTTFCNMGIAITAKVSEVTENIKNGFANMKNAVIAKASEIWTGVKTTFINMKNGVVNTVVELWNNVKTTFGNIKDSVIAKATELWEGIKGIFNGIKESIAGAFTSAVNTAIGGLNRLISAANNIHVSIPDWVPGVGGKQFGVNIPQIPALAQGGVVTKPTLAMIGEGSENEAIFPLSKLEQFLNGKTENNQNDMVFQIEYKPQIIVQGNVNADEIKNEIEKANALSQREFEKMLLESMRNFKRKCFA